MSRLGQKKQGRRTGKATKDTDQAPTLKRVKDQNPQSPGTRQGQKRAGAPPASRKR